VIILGAIGPVLGTIAKTLSKVKQCLKESGYILLDDGFIPQMSTFKHHKCLPETQFFEQIESSGFKIVDQYIIGSSEAEESNTIIYDAIKNRADELKEKYPGLSNLFDEYLNVQAKENQAIENELICGNWLLKAEK